MKNSSQLSRALLALAASLGFCLSANSSANANTNANAGPVMRVMPEAFKAELATLPKAARSSSFSTNAPLAFARQLSAPSASELAAASLVHAKSLAGGKALNVGFGRSLSAQQQHVEFSQLPWQTLADGRLAVKFSIMSPQARALRVELARDVTSSLQGLQLSFAGSLYPAIVEGPTGLAQLSNASNWSPVTFGHTMIVEAVLPAKSNPKTLRAAIGLLSHMHANPLRPSDSALAKVGESAACHINIACEALDGVEVQSSKAVARYTVTNAAGSSGTCTGTLINDSDPSTQVPHFISAEHCLNTQALADTITTLWNEQFTTCGGTTVSPSFSQVGGGMDLLAIEAAPDVILMRMRSAPPAGVYFTGWDATPPVFPQAFIDIHHPAGDVKKISRGSAFGLGNYRGTTDTHWEVRYTSGSTEPGSSGSGILTRDGNAYLLRGVLSAGSASCTNTQGTDVFGRLDLAPQTLAVLRAAPTQSALTGWWWDESRPGVGFGVEVRNGRLFVAGFFYADDGRANWFVSNGPMASATSYTGRMAFLANGQSLTGAYRAPTTTGPEGTFAIDFTSNTTASMLWLGGRYNLKRYDVPGGPGTAAGARALMPQRGWYYNAAEAGRGFMLEVQGNSIFLAGFMYTDGEGFPVWYIATGNVVAAANGASSFSANWQQVGNGQTLSGPFRAAAIVNANVGSVELNFASPTQMSLTLPGGRVIPMVRFTDF